MRGWHIMTGKSDGKWWESFTIYFGRHTGARFIGFFFPLHRGWCSWPRFWWNKSGWEYYEPAILTGRLFRDEGKWYRLGTWLVPARLVHLWNMRRRSYRDVMRNDRLEVQG